MNDDSDHSLTWMTAAVRRHLQEHGKAARFVPGARGRRGWSRGS